MKVCFCVSTLDIYSSFSSRNENDRSSQQFFNELSSSPSPWRSRASRVPEETREDIRSGPSSNLFESFKRSDGKNNRRPRYKTILDRF